MSDIVIYGATGYMGKLFTKEMVAHGYKPVLAGRSDKVKRVAAKFGCESSVFGLDDIEAIADALRHCKLVVNLAGPFGLTQKPLIDACLAAGCHYIDIAGEVDEMESAFAFDEQAKEAGLMLMPGAGFGVVPTDIAAKLAADQLPSATHLSIAYATEGGASQGTLKTVLKDINRTGVKRVDGQMVAASPAASQHTFTVGDKSFSAVTNPWRADLFTAGLSTGIANIDTYSVFPGFIVQMMRGRLLWLRNLMLNRLLRFLPEGPSEKQLQQGSTYVTATATSGEQSATVSFKGPEAYLFTAYCLREITRRILDRDHPPGFQTPAHYGRELLDGMVQFA